MAELERAVDGVFAETGRDLPRWPDPHAGGRMPREDEYSRVSDPAKWRIVPARAEAWCRAAVGLGIATLERDVNVRWADGAGGRHVRIDRLAPHRPGGLPVLFAYAAFEGDEPTAVTLAVGDPAVVVGQAPACGCDACDSGSEAELAELDRQVRDLLAGRTRHLRAGPRTIVATGQGWSATGDLRSDEVVRILGDPVGWTEVSGPGWLEPPDADDAHG